MKKIVIYSPRATGTMFTVRLLQSVVPEAAVVHDSAFKVAFKPKPEDDRGQKRPAFEDVTDEQREIIAGRLGGCPVVFQAHAFTGGGFVKQLKEGWSKYPVIVPLREIGASLLSRVSRRYHSYMLASTSDRDTRRKEARELLKGFSVVLQLSPDDVHFFPVDLPESPEWARSAVVFAGFRAEMASAFIGEWKPNSTFPADTAYSELKRGMVTGEADAGVLFDVEFEELRLWSKSDRQAFEALLQWGYEMPVWAK